MKPTCLLIVSAILTATLFSCKKESTAPNSGNLPVQQLSNMFQGNVNGTLKSKTSFPVLECNPEIQSYIETDTLNGFAWVLVIDGPAQTGNEFNMEDSWTSTLIAYFDFQTHTAYILKEGTAKVVLADPDNKVLKMIFSGTLISEDQTSELNITNGKITAYYQ